MKAIGIDAVRPKGSEVFGRCPMHYKRVGKMDRTPSNWSVNMDTGAHYCFSCGYGGSLIELVVDLTDMSWWEALRWLRDEGYVGLETIRDLADEEGFDNQSLPEYAPTVVEEWVLYTDPPKEALREKNVSLAACRHFDVRWRDGWCLPIKAYTGELMGFQLKNGRYFENKPEFVEKSKTLFGIEVFPPGEAAILVESPLDVLRLWDCGYNGGLAAFGVEVSGDQLDLVRQFTDTIIVALDNDAAGRRKTRDVYEVLHWTVPMLKFLDYTATGEKDERPKDIGDMTDQQLHAAMRSAKGAAAARMARLIPKKVEKDVRQSPGVPKSASDSRKSRNNRRRQGGNPRRHATRSR